MTFYGEPDRRQILIGAAAFGAAALAGQAAMAQDHVLTSAVPQLDDAEADRIAAEFLGGATAEDAGLLLELPALADNPAAVPVRVQIGADSGSDIYCEELIVLANRNPLPLASVFRFGPATGPVDVALRLRLIESMRVRAIARMSDGRFLQASAETTVAAGGCGM
ncbi:MAG: thiosulfate oxidation carrier protein SoxY [Paracoccus sp. (in: a-proteobacteria)]|uniref:thiosulfate oxidation carrier protein SoxY n=1 Tax=Paracoccus sp. TaxID=267 RepID=UPI0026DEBDF8|nr:thiosulfate oxidation carrier protein SoxY [Paracoccus sp. (in: a-proteobacteria)]MDO5631982.1 thiosulfate oxidation carrier protein SoxY [Paracoccus sp. (in: a-proteobacteria)]